MASNFPGPYEVEIFYTVDGIQHTQRINTNCSIAPSVGDAPSAISLANADATTTLLSVAVASWSAILQPLFNTADSIDYFNFWQYTPLTTVRSYITTGSIALNGTSGTAYNPAHQSTFTFRTAEGGVMRIVVLEDTSVVNIRTPYASVSGGFKTLMDYVFATNTWMLARDTSYPIAPLNWIGGQNEAVFRARYR